MTRAEVTPAATIVQLVAGRWVSACVSVVAELGIADVLADGPKTVEQIAKRVDATPDAVRRVLRALASLGVFAHDGDDAFANTPVSDALRTGPSTMRSFAIMAGEPPLTQAWNELLHSVRTGESAFEKVHRTGMFEYLSRAPELGRIFDAAMTSRSAMEVAAVTAAFDFGGVETLVDVGGGQGLLLATILAKSPTQRGILFDLPTVVAGAAPVLERAGVSSRCEVVSGDFFDTVPKGGDGYLMKHIVHDWDDATCVRILKNVHAASRPGAKLFVVDAVIAPGPAPSFAKLLDLQMLVMTHGGRERTRPEWERLLMAGGFELARVVDTGTPLAIIEATRA